MRGSIGYISSLLIIFSFLGFLAFPFPKEEFNLHFFPMGEALEVSITIRVGGEMAIIDRAGGYLTFHGGDRLLDRVKYMDVG